ncbi:hypothetical protein [Methylobacterium trifolii]|uniref:Uncharacterized protein n=1 Tax=Methylobacterium trifolii TaxID=1003092 RepID=A0ABQ4U338_9HYPH|nr:hypothetical protein [Methylobacterium trifolii]GJE61888.1 hypothetical protein MPOCJGCO_4014 [Methylobacterium trifolii]
MTVRALATACLLLAAPVAARADACDALAAKVIRVTGASVAGRNGPLAVFRAADAERMSLDCRAPRRMVLGALEREPAPAYFVLIGLAAQALTGARPAEVETLALVLHQDSLLAGAPRQGAAGPAALRCETGPRADGLAGESTVCVLAPTRPATPRRKAGLSRKAAAG